jgi:ELWxxDGT repeat protein
MTFDNSLRGARGKLFFTADDGMHGDELWSSDGTASGTRLLKDIEPGSAGSKPRELTDVDGTLLFTIHPGTDAGPYELWKSDGTARKTTKVADLRPDSAFEPDDYVPDDPYRFQLTNVAGTLFFRNFDPVHGLELWKSDGTARGTIPVKDVDPGPGGSDPQPLAAVNGTLFFATFDGAHGWAIWKTTPRIHEPRGHGPTSRAR